MRTTPSLPRLRSMSSPTFGMSRVISSGPSLVSRAPHSKSLMWMEVKVSFFTQRSLMRMASSKLKPRHGMKATSRFLPNASSPSSVAGPSARAWPFTTFWPKRTMGFWFTQVPALERRNFSST